ncbi:MAG: DUF896 domain-containing protein [Erysipelotrichaceae bacterium]|nr:DUF896 domain-containing protein [Erysipelotrichaceae bacterium]MDD3808687.1 DUF896 domain-containing protein [Erysipelotrichaceae bacterium]
MMDQKLIDRINELARKKKVSGLSDEELLEQQLLRQRYLEEFRAGFKQRLESVKVIDEDGNDITPTNRIPKTMN